MLHQVIVDTGILVSLIDRSDRSREPLNMRQAPFVLA